MATTHRTVFFLNLLLLVLLTGCSQLTDTTSNGESGLIRGQLPAGTEGTVIARGNEREWRTPVAEDGSYALSVGPGRYQILLESPAKSLSLISKGLTIEDNMTISLLDVQLVPIPRILSVSVPLVYDTGAVIEWETDIDSDGRVEYGRDERYGSSLSTDGGLKRKHQVQLNPLDADTTYHFRIVVSRHALEIAQNISPDYRFTTEPTGPTAGNP